MKKRLTLLTAVLGTAFAAGVAAADFSISVPVELRSLQPAITRVKVSCVVQTTSYFDNNPNLNLGTGASAPQVVTNGEFVGTLTVAVNAYSGKDPAMGKGYRCDLHLEADGKWFIAKTNPTYPFDPAKPAKTIVTGTIPK